MPRANRIFLPGHTWHITERCHEQRFLLRASGDRRRWRWWLSEAKRRYRLCVLNYIVTRNHIHLLVRDRGQDEIPASMRLIAGRTAQEYNRRKSRRGAFWEDRYHATCVDSERYLARCIVYIDLNMVRAGVVEHPQDWEDSGFRELHFLPENQRILDTSALLELLGIADDHALRRAHLSWVEESLAHGTPERDACWSEAVAVGGREFVQRFLDQSGIRTRYRKVIAHDDGFMVKEAVGLYAPDCRRRPVENLGPEQDRQP